MFSVFSAMPANAKGFPGPSIAATATSFSGSGSLYDTTYWWRLSAMNDNGWGPATAEVSITTGPRPRTSGGGSWAC